MTEPIKIQIAPAAQADPVVPSKPFFLWRLFGWFFWTTLKIIGIAIIAGGVGIGAYMFGFDVGNKQAKDDYSKLFRFANATNEIKAQAPVVAPTPVAPAPVAPAPPTETAMDRLSKDAQLKAELKTELKAELRAELLSEVKTEFEENFKDEVRADLKKEVDDEVARLKEEYNKDKIAFALKYLGL